jgi:single-stranded-DNA-specific exonuclease
MKNKKIVYREVPDNINLPDLIHPVLKRVYASRNIKSSKDLDYSLSSLIPFEQLSGINDAVILLQEMLEKKKRMLIIADFDADGATSCALAIRGLTAMGAKDVIYVVPNRFEHGYGLSPEIVDVALDYDPDLIITVDNGISSICGVEYARKNGVKVLITDHHLPAKELPNADVIINPQLANDKFPSKNLAGVGVIFYILLALRAKLKQEYWFENNNIDYPNLANFLDLVALGTIADLVPLDKNNRTMVAHGLKLIKNNKSKPGIYALLNQAGRQLSKLTSSDLSFAVAPRLNAAGRLTDMSLGIECLLTDDEDDAIKIAEKLNRLNIERRKIQDNMQEEALAELEKYLQDTSGEIPYGICIYDKDWHQGVVGILASKIKEKFNRPVIVFAKENEGVLKGSARSISGLHIKDVFDEIATLHPDLILTFGGHAMAAGLTIKESEYSNFSNIFNKYANQYISSDRLEDAYLTDGELSDEDFTVPLAQAIQDAGPWGQSFPEPTFAGQFKILDKRVVGENHLKLKLQSRDNSATLDAIAFNMTDTNWPPETQQIVSTYRLGINDFQGNTQVQLFLEHIEPS